MQLLLGQGVPWWGVPAQVQVRKIKKKHTKFFLFSRTLETVVDEGLEVTAFSKKLMKDRGRGTQAQL